jgi:WD repeat-containing protein 48
LLAHSKTALVSASSDITVKVWRPTEDKAIDIGKHNDYVKCLASPSSHSDWVASGGLDHTIRVWDLNGAGEKLSINTSEDGDKGSIYALSVRGSIMASGGPDSILRLWDPKSGKIITKFVGHTDNVRDILINEAADVVMTASSDQTIKIWSMAAGRCVSTLTMHNDSVWSLYSDHPQLSVFYSGDRSGMIAKTDIRDTGLSLAIAHEHGGVTKIISDGDSIWSATSSSSINRWKDVDQSKFTRKSSSVLSVLPSFDSASIQEPEPEEIVPYHTLPVETIEGQNGLIKHEILNDRKRVLTLDTAGEVVLWDLLRCVPIKSFGKRHLDDVRPEVDTIESVANWCTVATKAGSLTVALEENYCFDAEVYADQADVDLTDFREDQRINLGKWVLRYLFAGLIDEEIRRDEKYRRSSGLNLGPLPPRKIDWDDESITTPKAIIATPGLSIGIASPGLTQVQSNGSKTPLEKSSGDYFSPKEPSDDVPEDSKPSWKKLRLPLKKLAKTPEIPKPVVDDKSESDKSVEEKPIEDNFYGVIQKIRQDYDHDSQTAITPSQPNETPVINPPLMTSIIIQEDAPESGGLADLYRGTVGSVGKDADEIEKVAPMWLGDLLLRVCSLNVFLCQLNMIRILYLLKKSSKFLLYYNLFKIYYLV